MRQNRVKRIMREGSLAIVSHVGFADPAVIEIIAMAGFDGAFIDMEHTVFDLQLVGEMIRVAEGRRAFRCRISRASKEPNGP
jgi:2-keto-3-deoxy-L-rhamnonate aldolase RhmA